MYFWKAAYDAHKTRLQFNYFLVLALLLMNACSLREQTKSSDNVVQEKIEIRDGWYNVAFLVMEGTYNTEWTAAFDIFHHTRFRTGIKPMNVFSVANTNASITTFEGLKIKPDFNYLLDSIPPIDLFVVPSAEHHMDSDLEDNAMIKFVKQVSAQCLFVTSHCDGAFVLAKAGLLDGKHCTTFPSDREAMQKMFPQTQVLDSFYWVHEDKYITSVGGAKTFEAALYVCQLLYGETIAKELGKGLVIDWDAKKFPHRYFGQH